MGNTVDLMLAQQGVSNHMDKILSYFNPGAKITVLVRSPGFPDRDFMMTNDTIQEAVELLNRRAEQTGAGKQ